MKKIPCVCVFLVLILAGCQQPVSKSGKADPANAPAATVPGTDADGSSPTDGSPVVVDDPSKPDVPGTKPVATALTIVSSPKRCGYEVGDKIDLAGISVSVSWSDGTKTTPDVASLSVSPVDAPTSGPSAVSVSYENLSASFGIYVISADYFVNLEGGLLSMGSDLDRDTDNPVHSVSVSPFRVARFELTYGFWSAVRDWIAANPKAGFAFSGKGREGHDGAVGAKPEGPGDEPVTYVSWIEAVVWCNAFSEMFGLSPAYCADAAGTSPLRSTDWSGDVFVNADADGFRLPSEAEWEYSAGRAVWAGTDDEAKFPDYAWFSKNAQDAAGKGSTWPVGQKIPNASGLYDMSGNVAEWCADWYDPAWYASSPSVNPSGPTVPPAPENAARVIRGGSYSSALKDLRVASRKSLSPSSRSSSVGFRVVRPAVVR